MPLVLVHVTERNVEGKRFLVNALDGCIRPSGAGGAASAGRTGVAAER